MLQAVSEMCKINNRILSFLYIYTYIYIFHSIEYLFIIYYIIKQSCEDAADLYIYLIIVN